MGGKSIPSRNIGEAGSRFGALGADLQGRGQPGRGGRLHRACENHRGLLLGKSRQRLPHVQRQQSRNKGFPMRWEVGVAEVGAGKGGSDRIVKCELHPAGSSHCSCEQGGSQITLMCGG